MTYIQYRSEGCFKNVHEILNLRALKISTFYKNQCMGKIFIPHKISNPYIEKIQFLCNIEILTVKSSYAFLNPPTPPTPPPDFELKLLSHLFEFFMCHHELWATSVSRPFSSLNCCSGFTEQLCLITSAPYAVLPLFGTRFAASTGGHLYRFHRAISHLKWYKIVCKRYLACIFI